ncbi:MAG: DNA-methyltransferase [Luteolibacter sp.]
MTYAATDPRKQTERPSALGPCVCCALGDDVRLYLGDCRDIMPLLTGIDAVISDPPFSARTHAGHDAVKGDGHTGNGTKTTREVISYAAWSDEEVWEVCKALPDHGWACILTDHVLARDWERRMKEVGRYVFAPIPVIARGRSVRLTGDGPSSWTDWLIPARTKAEIKWGTLPGVYEGSKTTIEHKGGKPLNAMCRIVEDYSRPGDTVLDFCMGAGTTAIACLRTGRKFIGIEKDPQHFDTARQRIERELEQGRLAL